MIEDYLELRNELHPDSFRFDMSVDLWKSHYLPSPDAGRTNTIEMKKNGVLEGYAVYEIMTDEQIRALRILEICGSRKAYEQLIDRMVEQAVRDELDFVFIRKNEEPVDTVFDEKKFISFVDCAILSAPLNPRELLRSMSERVEQGHVLGLDITGFPEILVRVGRRKMEIVENMKPSVVMKVDGKTFVKLFFGKTSLLKEYLKRNVVILGKSRIFVAARFFNAIKQKRTYIPLGDWV